VPCMGKKKKIAGSAEGALPHELDLGNFRGNPEGGAGGPVSSKSQLR